MIGLVLLLNGSVRVPGLQLNVLTSVAALRSCADAWDDLWRRSDATLPTARAALTALWVERFAPKARFRALVVEHDGRFLAALPLVDQRVKRVFRFGGMTGDCWSPAGDLLLAPDCTAAEALGMLAEGLAEAPWPLLWLDTVALDAAHWKFFVKATQSAGLRPAAQFRYQIERVQIADDWQSYTAHWSKSHRRAVRRKRDLEHAAGGMQLRVESPPPADVESQLRRIFEVEDRSWKASRSTSVLRTPGMFEFYRRQATQLAEWRQLRLLTLEHRDRVIAYEYGFVSKGVYYSFKVGFDLDFARFSPGQLLRLKYLERCFAERDVKVVDFLGPSSRSTASWATDHYRLGRLVLAPRRLTSRGLAWLFRRLKAVEEATSAEEGPRTIATDEATVDESPERQLALHAAD